MNGYFAFVYFWSAISATSVLLDVCWL